ncbi:hypothetical protein [Nonomuraea recticatena]|uniref:Uncharacterized protein n=1 Tax=Nonomuraea recticatena TaxID=46178 RepID=A0ABP6FJ63_9ACTN
MIVTADVEQPRETPSEDERVAGYVVVDAAQAGDQSGWMTPRMRATAKQAHDDLVFWRGTARSGSSMDLHVAKIVLLDPGSGSSGVQ